MQIDVILKKLGLKIYVMDMIIILI